MILTMCNKGLYKPPKSPYWNLLKKNLKKKYRC